METGSTLAAIPLPSLKYQISVVPTPPLIPSVLMGFIVGSGRCGSGLGLS